MDYKSNVDAFFEIKQVGDSRVIYRLFHSASENGGYFILLTSKGEDATEDVFLPFLAADEATAKDIFALLRSGEVTPASALEVIDEYLGNL